MPINIPYEDISMRKACKTFSSKILSGFNSIFPKKSFLIIDKS